MQHNKVTPAMQLDMWKFQLRMQTQAARNRAHAVAANWSRKDPQRSDPFSYSRALSAMLQGTASPEDFDGSGQHLMGTSTS